MIKKILSPTDGSDASMAAVDYAITVAEKCQAALELLYVVDVKLLEGPFTRDLAVGLGAATFLDGQADLLHIFEERGRQAVAAARERCEAAGIRCEGHIAMGIVPRVIVEQSELTDLVVMGRGGEHTPWLEGVLGSTTQSVVRRTTVPVLVTGTAKPAGKGLLVAYDGSAHAKRALRTGVSIAEDWNLPLRLLAFSPHAETLVGEAREYLQSHAISVECSVDAVGEPGEAIIRHVCAYEARLLIMGAYGHSKLREMFLGSTTAYVLNHAACPVLLIR